MSADQRRKGLEFRKLANEALLAKKPTKAVEYFTLALLDPSAPERRDHVVALHCGRASAYNAIFGYDLAVLDACAALKYKDDYSKALERRALARKGLGEFRLAADDFTGAAECSTEQNYRRRMLDEVKRMKQTAIEDEELEKTINGPLERDFEQARLELSYKGDNLDKNPTARSILNVYNEIDDGWKRFWETCDPESDNPDLEGLFEVLEAAAFDPRALHFTSRAVPSDQLLAKLDLLASRHARPLDTDSLKHFVDLVPNVGIDGPKGVKSLVDRWLVLHLIQILRKMSNRGLISPCTGPFCTVLETYKTLMSLDMLSFRLSTTVAVWEFACFCAYRVLLIGRRLNDQKTNEFITKITSGIRANSTLTAYPAEEGQEPPEKLSERRCTARAYLVDAFLLRSRSQLPENVDFLNTRKNVYWPNAAWMKTAQQFAEKAVELLSDEDEEKAFAETVALCCRLESEGGVLRNLLSTVARIQCIRDRTKRFFGPSPRNEECEVIVRQIIGRLPSAFLGVLDPNYSRMNARPKTLEDFLNLRLRPVGTVVCDKSSQKIGDHQDRDVLRYMDKQMGDLSLWSFEAVADFEQHQGAKFA